MRAGSFACSSCFISWAIHEALFPVHCWDHCLSWGVQVSTQKSEPRRIWSDPWTGLGLLSRYFLVLQPLSFNSFVNTMFLSPFVSEWLEWPSIWFAWDWGLAWDTGLSVLKLGVLSHFSCVWLCVTPWTVAHHAHPFMRFSKQGSMYDKIHYKLKKKNKNTGVGCQFFSRKSSLPRGQTHVSYASCIGRWVLYH